MARIGLCYGLIWGVIVLLAGCNGQKGITASAPTITFDSQSGKLTLQGLSACLQDRLTAGPLTEAAWKRVWKVYVGDSLPEVELQAYPILGEYERVGNAFTFTPQFAWMAAQPYFTLVQIDTLTALLGCPVSGPQNLTYTFELPSQKKAPTTLTHIYPTSDTLPANLLKFYLHFSAAMNRSQGYQSVRLVDSEGQEVSQAFVEMKPALWDSAGQRMTLLLHPGRIKQGLAFREGAGPILTPGNRYCLEIASTWHDALGRALAQSYQKCFWVWADDRERIQPTAWHITPPSAGTQEALHVQFDESLDHALLQRMLMVIYKEEVINGTIEVTEDGKSWNFSPESPWIQGDYLLYIDPLLEDLAGNTTARLFDQAMGDENEAGKLEIGFRVEN